MSVAALSLHERGWVGADRRLSRVRWRWCRIEQVYDRIEATDPDQSLRIDKTPTFCRENWSAFDQFSNDQLLLTRLVSVHSMPEWSKLLAWLRMYSSALLSNWHNKPHHYSSAIESWVHVQLVSKNSRTAIPSTCRLQRFSLQTCPFATPQFYPVRSEKIDANYHSKVGMASDSAGTSHAGVRRRSVKDQTAG